MEFRLPPYIKEFPKNASSIKFWDPLRHKWSERGCLGQVDDDYTITATCNHLTSFAVLFQLTANPLAKPDNGRNFT